MTLTKHVCSALSWLILLIGSTAGCCHISSDQKLPDLNAAVRPLPAPPTVLYITGFRFQQTRGNEDVVRRRQQHELALLQEAFPGSTVIYLHWDNAVQWSKCVENANQVILHLEKHLFRLSPAERENLILVGHSLGARIAIRTMAWLHRHNCKIRRGIFLAAAFPDDDPDLQDAVAASKQKAINIYCPADGTLRFVLGLVCGRSALGAYGAASPPRNLVQFEINPTFTGKKWINNHWSILYLQHMKDALKLKGQGRIRMPDVVSHLPYVDYAYNASETLLWCDLDDFRGWRFQKKRFFPFTCRILDRRDFIRAVGPEEHLAELWNKISGRIP